MRFGVRSDLVVVTRVTLSPLQTIVSTLAVQVLPDRAVICTVLPGDGDAPVTRAPQAPERSFAGVAAMVVVVLIDTTLSQLAGTSTLYCTTWPGCHVDQRSWEHIDVPVDCDGLATLTKA